MITDTYSITEWRAILQRELKEYEASIKRMKAEERKSLYEWVDDDNSVYSNPFYIYDEDGRLVDYIAAFRQCMKEYKVELRRELKKYEAAIDNLTDEERQGLREWVAGDNSVYNNPYYLSDGRGNPIDFIEAIRVSISLREEYERNESKPEPEFIMPEDGIPF